MVMINPGARIPNEGDEATAVVNMEIFCRDLQLAVTVERRPAHDDDSDFGRRYAFVVTYPFNGNKVTVDMPGVPVEIIGARHYRLYVNGTSWYWGNAVNIAQSNLLEVPRGGR